MKEMIWLFPLLFIIHDMEEIIGLPWWIHKHQKLLQDKFPRFETVHGGLTTEGFALAVFEELLIVIGLSWLCLVTDVRALTLLWIGGLIGYTLHLGIHMLQSVLLKRYIPALVTSFLCLPPSFVLIHKAVQEVQATPFELVVATIIGGVIIGINLVLALALGRWFSAQLRKRS